MFRTFARTIASTSKKQFSAFGKWAACADSKDKYYVNLSEKMTAAYADSSIRNLVYVGHIEDMSISKVNSVVGGIYWVCTINYTNGDKRTVVEDTYEEFPSILRDLAEGRIR